MLLTYRLLSILKSLKLISKKSQHAFCGKKSVLALVLWKEWEDSVKMRWGKRILIGLAAGLLGSLTGCGREDAQVREEVPQYVFRYAENQALEHPAAQAAYRFAELVEERTGGRIQIVVYPEAELGDESSVIEQLQYGGIDFARVSVMTMGELIPKLNVLQLPYLYEDAGHMWRVLDGEIGEELREEFDAYQLHALSWYDAGSRNFYTVGEPVRCLEDMAGMRIRVAESELMTRMVQALGAEPVRMVYSEVYSGLETGGIDGAENNWPSYESAGHSKVAKYMTLDEHNRIPEVQLVSSLTWEKLGEADREIIRQCAKESAVYQRKLWQEMEAEARGRCEEEGCQVTELTEQEKKRFREAAGCIYEEFAEEYGDLVERIQAQ